MSAYVCTSVFFVRQKTAYEMGSSDCSSDVCSSDLARLAPEQILAITACEPIFARIASDVVIAVEPAQRVAARAADDRVGERVAIAGKIGGAAADQLFDIAGDRVAVQRRFDPVEPGARRLGDPVACVVDEEDVVARGAKQRIRRRSGGQGKQRDIFGRAGRGQLGRASWRERVWQYV